MKQAWYALLLLAFVAATPLGAEPIPAFPGAQGFGMHATGGRGGSVYYVENLADSGPGSLRDAVSQPNRIVVFAVSGIIELESPVAVRQPNITVAGQTAPGDGICLKRNGLNVAADNVIVRYLRCRPGDVSGGAPDSLSVGGGKNVIIDHCSASWSVDEALSVTGETTDNVTVQWCIISESLHDSCHPKGPHGMGSLLRPHAAHLSFHHNLYAHNNSRNPRPGTYGGATMTLDFRNNTIYDWGATAGYSGGKGEFVHMNYIANYLLSGPSTRTPTCAFASGSTDTLMYQVDNRIDKQDTGWDMIQGKFTQATGPFDIGPFRTDEVAMAHRTVLADVGAWLPARDAVDMRVLDDVRERGGKVIDSQSDVGGWPALYAAPVPTDSDRDGMPDYWERQFGLQTSDATDGPTDADGDGYTNVEEYLNNTLPDGTDGPLVFVSSSAAPAADQDAYCGMLIFQRTGPLKDALEVSFSTAGTAVAGEDYAALPDSITLPSGATKLSLPVAPLGDIDEPKTVIVSLTPSESYHVGLPCSALVALSE